MGAFFLCTFWSCLLGILESLDYNAEDRASLVPILVLQAWFLPFQGIVNAFIYIRPKYMKHRERCPDETKLWALLCCVLGKRPRSRLEPFQPKLGSSIKISENDHCHRFGPDDTSLTQQEEVISSIEAKPADLNIENPQFKSSEPSGNFNIQASVTGEDSALYYSSVFKRDTTLRDELQAFWRCKSGTNNPRQVDFNCGGMTSTFLESISESSSISFVDQEDDD